MRHLFITIITLLFITLSWFVSGIGTTTRTTEVKESITSKEAAKINPGIVRTLSDDRSVSYYRKYTKTEKITKTYIPLYVTTELVSKTPEVLIVE